MDFLTYGFLPAAGILLLLCAAFGNTRVFLSAIWGLLAFGISAALAFAIVENSNMGWGALLFIPVVIGIGLVVFIAHLVRSQIGKNAKKRVTLPRSARLTAATAGALCLVAAVTLANWDDIGDRAYRRAIASNNTTVLTWCLKTWKNNYAAWDALENREPGPETLRLLAFLITPREDGYSTYHRNIWDILVRQPSGPERLEVARELLRRNDHVSDTALLALYDQKDWETFEHVLQTTAPESVFLALAKTGRYDIAREALRRALLRSDSGRLPQEVRNGIHIYNFLPDTELLAQLLSAGVDPNTKDDYGRNALQLALRANNDKAVQLLLSAGANPCLQDAEGRDALFYAIIFNRENFFPRFLAFCPDTARRDASGLTALHWAAWFGNLDMVEHLLARRVPTDADTPPNAPTPLFYAVQGGGPQTLDLLLRMPEGRRPNPAAAGDDRKSTVLRAAVKGIPLYTLCDALESSALAGFQPHAYGLDESKTALVHWRMLQERKTKVTGLLLLAGADASRTLPNGDTVLHAFFKTQGLEAEMLEHPLDPTASYNREYWCRNSFDRQPAIEAMLEREYREMLDALLLAGAAPNGASAEEICAGDVYSQQGCLDAVTARLKK